MGKFFVTGEKSKRVCDALKVNWGKEVRMAGGIDPLRGDKVEVKVEQLSMSPLEAELEYLKSTGHRGSTEPYDEEKSTAELEAKLKAPLKPHNHYAAVPPRYCG